MKLHRSTWISLGLASLLCATALFWQKNRIRVIRAEIDSPLNDVPVAGRQISGILVSEPGLKITGENKKLSMDEILALASDKEHTPTLEMLEAFSSYSIEELFGALETLSETKSKPFQFDVLKELLLEAVCQDDPERVLEMVDAGKLDAKRGYPPQTPARDRAFRAIAAKDVDRARSILRSCDWEEADTKWARNLLVQAMMRSDLPSALEYLREHPKALGGQVGHHPIDTALGGIVDDEASRKALWKALAHESNFNVRNQLVRGLVDFQFDRGGIEAAKVAAEKAAFLGERWQRATVRNYAIAGLPREPDRAYGWLRESGDPNQIGEILTQGIKHWASSDFNAAGEWLGTLEPSSEKDAAVFGVVETIAGIDRQSAAVWVAEIGDEELRKAAEVIVEGE